MADALKRATCAPSRRSVRENDLMQAIDPTLGLRERKKIRTRETIRQEAFRLIEENGYAATTVEQIAEAAEVSPSTFFRYFPTKESVLLADDIIDAQEPCLKQMMRVFEETQCSVIATQVVEGPAISAYGVLDVKPADGRFDGRLFEINSMVEKPKPEDAPSNLAIIGRYILTPRIFEILASTPHGSGGELQLTDGLMALLREQRIYAYVYEGRRYDAGDKLGFLKATVELALKREELGDKFREYLKGLKL